MTATATIAPETPAPARPEPSLRARLVPPMPADRVWGWLGPLLVTLLAGWLRFDRLDVPRTHVFDEVYYARDAWSLLHHAVEIDNATKGPGFVAHPPLGKWAIALGELLFGNNALGWRFSAALAGTATVLLVARIGRRLFRSTLLGCIAGLLLALDGLHFVQSRTSMLDIFLTFWVLAAFGCLLVDRDRTRLRLAATADPQATLGGRPWRLAAGACLGAGCATKWSGIYFLAAFALLSLAWDLGARRTAGARSPLLLVLRRDALPAAGALVALAAVVYTVSWTGWFLANAKTAYAHDRFVGGRGLDSVHPLAVLHGWFRYHSEIWHFHATLTTSHPYQSHAIGWLLLARPVSYFYSAPRLGELGCTAATCSKEVLAIGTPAIWWAGIPALVAVLWLWVARRDWRAGALLVAVAAGIAPWGLSDLRERTMFLFYSLPSVPFLTLALAMCAGLVLGRAGSGSVRRQAGAAAVAAYLLVVLANFGYLYPVLAAKVLPYDSWLHRMWFPSWI